MASMTKEEKISKLASLINEGENLIRTESYEMKNFSFDYSDPEPTVDYYTVVDDSGYPAWRTKSLALLENILGFNDITYLRTFENNCGADATEHNLKQGIGVLKALQSAVQDGTFKEKEEKTANSLLDYPDKYWHCAIKMLNQKDYSVINDLFFEELKKKITQPWLHSKPFTVDGKIVNKRENLEEIKIAQTPKPMEYYKRIHDEKMKQAHLFDAVTDRRMLPLDEGNDYTQELLFENKLKQDTQLEDPSITIVERVCQRIGKTANLLKTRTRAGKKGYVVEDEYDVQDLLQATLRAFIQHSIQENPLPKIAGNSSRADITVEELGLIIEVKYVRSPNDQKQLVEDFAQDILLYSQWEHLREFIYLIYNSADLRDPEELESLSGLKEISGKKFNSKVILG